MSLDFYRNRTLNKGRTSKDRIIYEKRNSFDRFLELAPDAYDVVIDGEEHRAIIQDRRFNDEELTDKFMLTRFDTPIEEGMYVYWNDAYWIIDHKEEETIQGHQSCKIARCNNTLKWQDASGNIQEIPCVVADKTSVYSDGLSKTGGLFTIGIDQVSALVQENEVTSKLRHNKRFIFDNSSIKIYNLTRIDAVTVNGLIRLIMKKSDYDNVTDRLDINIADYIDMENNLPPIDDETIEIRGSDKVSIWSEGFEYTINTSEEIEWSISNYSLATIKEQSNGSCFLVPNGKSKLGTVTIIATLRSEPFSTYKKDIKITYM